MVKKSLILVLFLITLLIVACTAEKPATKVSEPQPTAVVEPAKTSAPSAPAKQMTAEVKSLLELHQNIKSIKFTRDTGTNPQTFYVKSGKFKKTVTPPGKYSDPSENYDTVYVDRTAQTAYAYCADLSPVKCPNAYRQSAYAREFKSEDIILPLELLQGINYAEKVGSEDIENRKTSIIQFTNEDGQKEKLWLDPYFGFVFRQVIYDANDQVIERHTFTNVAFNSLTDQDVSLPEGLEIK